MSRRARRGKNLVGEPYFVPGTPLLLDRKGLGEPSPATSPSSSKAADEHGSSACSAAPTSIETVLEGLLVAGGRATRLRALRPAADHDRGPRRPPRRALVHDRPGDREGLRRRAHGDRGPGLRAHRRRLVVRPGGLAARPRRPGARVLRLRAGAGLADAAARALGGALLAATEHRPALPDRRGAARRRAPGRRAALLPLGDPQPRAPDLLAARGDSARARAGRAGPDRGAAARRAARDRAARPPLRARSAPNRERGGRHSPSTARAESSEPGARPSPMPTCWWRS